MQQRVINSLLSVLCCFSFAACNEDKTDLLSDGDADILQLGADITGLTRANDAGFEVDDSIGVYVVKWKSYIEQDSLLNMNNYADNVSFRLENAVNQTWIPDHIIYYPNDDHQIDLCAYYPYRTPAFGSGTVINLSVATNQSVAKNYTRSDFMVAQTDSISRTPFKVPLIFNHKLSQMVFELLPGAGMTVNDLMNAKIEVINAITDATFDLATTKGGNPVTGTNRANITPCGMWREVSGLLTGMKAIIIPQPINTTTYIQVTIGNRRFTYKPTEAQNLNIGCSRKFIITINNTGLDITTTIIPWDNCPLIEGNAEEEFPLLYMQHFTPTGHEEIGTQVILTDKRDRISYRGVKMADGRWWMSENLKYNIAGSIIYYNSPDNLKKYGRMYTWQQAMDATPTNWNLPSDDEWKTLEMALGLTQEDANKIGNRSSGNVGTKLKQNGSSKLNLLLTGNEWNGKYYNLNIRGYYWTSTEDSSSYGWRRYLINNETGVYRDFDDKLSHISVRYILKEHI